MSSSSRQVLYVQVALHVLEELIEKIDGERDVAQPIGPQLHKHIRHELDGLLLLRAIDVPCDQNVNDVLQVDILSAHVDMDVCMLDCITISIHAHLKDVKCGVWIDWRQVKYDVAKLYHQIRTVDDLEDSLQRIQYVLKTCVKHTCTNSYQREVSW